MIYPTPSINKMEFSCIKHMEHGTQASWRETYFHIRLIIHALIDTYLKRPYLKDTLLKLQMKHTYTKQHKRMQVNTDDNPFRSIGLIPSAV